MFGEMFILALLSSTVFRLQTRVSHFFQFVLLRRKKGFYQSSLENEVDFRDIMNISPNILTKNQNFKNLRHEFVDERALITKTLTSSCHWKILVPFCLPRKSPENTFLILIVNYRKIVQKKQIMPSETTINWLFNGNDVIYSLLVLIEKLALLNKQL